MNSEPWGCPFCRSYSTIRSQDFSISEHELYIENRHGARVLKTTFVVCANPNCREYSLGVTLFAGKRTPHGRLVAGEEIRDWRLLPDSDAKVFPDYIPEKIRAAYTEACWCLSGSPDAAAVLSRRCLQGMIRNLWSIEKRTLWDEIDEIKDQVEPLTWKAIDKVRKFGAIGAHLKKDVNEMISVKPEEASKLVKLVELLMHQWYVQKHERENQLEEIADLGNSTETE